jgi:hypothetical protein
VKNENADLLADSYNILIDRRSTSQLSNVHRTSDVRQVEIHAVEPLVPDHSHFEFVKTS